MSKYDTYRENVLRVSQTLSEDGYFGTRSGSGGNVSVLIDDEDAIAITPSGKPYESLTESDICIVGLDQKWIECPSEPSVETGMHIAVYQNRRDVNSVIHTHQPYASIFALMNEPIPALFDEVAITIGPMVEVVPYGLSGSPELLANVVSKLGNRCHCYILQNHGALSIGRNLDKTAHYVELLEKTACAYYRALSTGRPVTVLPEEVALGVFEFAMCSRDMEIARKDSLAAKAQ